MHNGNTHLPEMCAGEAPDKKLKINKLGPYICADLLSTREGSPSKGGCILYPPYPTWIRHCFVYLPSPYIILVCIFLASHHHSFLIVYRLVATAMNDYQEVLSSYVAQNNESQAPRTY